MKIKCSQCGAFLEIGPMDKFIECMYCGTSLLIIQGETLLPKLVLPEMDQKRARDMLFEKIGEYREPKLFFVPYWVEENRLVLAVKAMEFELDLPLIRTKPSGKIIFRKDFKNEAEIEFLDPIMENEKSEKKERIIYIPYYIFYPQQENDDKNIYTIDAIDESILNINEAKREYLFNESVKDVIWCGSIFFVPVVIVLFGGNFVLAIGATLFLIFTYFVFRK